MWGMGTLAVSCFPSSLLSVPEKHSPAILHTPTVLGHPMEGTASITDAKAII